MDPEAHQEQAGPGRHGGADREPPSSGGEGGDPVCWLHLVCPECGRIADQAQPGSCPCCGARIGD